MTTKLKELLAVFDNSRQHIETLINILESNQRNDGHKIANQIFMIDMTVIDIQKKVEHLKKVLL